MSRIGPWPGNAVPAEIQGARGTGSRELRARNLEVITDFPGQKIVHFAMPRNCGGSPRLWVDVDGVVAALAEKLAAMPLQMPDEIDAFQAAGRVRGSRMTSAPS